jgi:hypothetical protein
LEKLAKIADREAAQTARGRNHFGLSILQGEPGGCG